MGALLKNFSCKVLGIFLSRRTFDYDAKNIEFEISRYIFLFRAHFSAATFFNIFKFVRIFGIFIFNSVKF